MSSAPDTRRRPHRVYRHPARDDLGNEKSVFKGGIDVEGGSIKHLMLLTYGRGQPPDRTAPPAKLHSCSISVSAATIRVAA
jgi:hypothetical protein